MNMIMKYLKLFEQWVNEKKGDSYSSGCAMLYFDFPQMSEIHGKISKDDLYEEEGDRTYGLENEPHVTLLFGIHSDDVEDKDIMETCCTIKYGSLTLHNISAFKNEKYDVLKFDIKGDGLQECNKKLSVYPHSNSFPDYHPHCTIAYLKSGTADKYIKEMKDIEYKVDPKQVVYSKPSGEKIKEDI
jgi:2'-5' RNA ligase